MSIRVIEVKEIDWKFRSGNPRMSMGKTSTEIDPVPAYPHDKELVRQLAKEIEPLFSLNTIIYLLHREETSRTNGWASPESEWDEGKDKFIYSKSTVSLCAKRIPIHPAMTRYLVPHELGHCVQYWLETQWDYKHHDLHNLYGEKRGVRPVRNYGPGTWHKAPIEIFANDFRICVANAEEEFWPHPTIERPTDQFREWWGRVVADPSKERLEELRELNNAT